MKIVKNDYPFKVIIEDKKSKNTGKEYQAISIAYTEKNNNATCEADKYKTTFINFFDERDLLKLSSVAENAYQSLKAEREKERLEKKKLLNGTVKPDLPKTDPNEPFIDDDIGF
jgi:putative lipase involved disintegration of autophagic bodies